MKPMFPPALGAVLFRQLAAASRHGLPFGEVLAILREDRSLFGRNLPVVDALADAFEEGRSLSSTMALFPGLFAAETTALVAAAESAGHLPATLEALADDCQRRAQGRSALRSALTWPAVLSGLVAALATIMMVFVIPSFEMLFAGFGAELPGPTQLVIGVSGILTGYGWILLLAALAGGILWYRGALPPALGRTATTLAMRVPYVRDYVLSRHLARVLTWLAAFPDDVTMCRAALAHVAATSRTPVAREGLEQLDARLAAGGALGPSLVGVPALPDRLGLLVRLGERTAGRRAAIALFADTAEADELAALQRFEQGLMLTVYLLLGLVVGTIVFAMYLPIFKLGAVI